jgi:hypothetical protein
LGLTYLLDPHYLIHLDVPMKDDYSLRRAHKRMIIPLSVPKENSCCLGLGWLSSPSAMNLVDFQVQVSWVWRVCRLPMLPWSWLTTKSKCLGSDGWPSPSALGLACLLDLCYLGPGWLSSPSAMDLARTTTSKCLRSDMFARSILPHLLERTKKGSFF